MKITQRKDKRFSTQIKTPDGSYKTVYGRTSKECRQKAYDVIAQIEDGSYIKKDKTTFGQWSEDWVSDYLIGVKDSTKKNYKNRLSAHLLPAFKNTPVQAIQPKEVQKFFTGLHSDKKLSPNTIQSIHAVLHKCLDDAIKAELIKNNPANNITLPKKGKSPITPLTEKDLPIFYEAAKVDKYYPLYVFLVLTGLRICELTGLTFDRIDIKNKAMRIDRQLIRNNPVKLDTPKGGKIRTVPLTETALQIIKNQKIKQAEIRLLIGASNYNPLGFVFTRDNGKPCDSKTILKALKQTSKQAGFPNLRLHDLRHTYAVLSLQAGVDIKTIQENLGHHSAAFTLDQYAFVTDNMRQTSATKLEKFVNLYVK